MAAFRCCSENGQPTASPAVPLTVDEPALSSTVARCCCSCRMSPQFEACCPRVLSSDYRRLITQMRVAKRLNSISKHKLKLRLRCLSQADSDDAAAKTNGTASSTAHARMNHSKARFVALLCVEVRLSTSRCLDSEGASTTFANADGQLPRRQIHPQKPSRDAIAAWLRQSAVSRCRS